MALKVALGWLKVLSIFFLSIPVAIFLAIRSLRCKTISACERAATFTASLFFMAFGILMFSFISNFATMLGCAYIALGALVALPLVIADDCRPIVEDADTESSDRPHSSL